jgi:amino acid adenylation domain-containing protein
MSDLSQRIANLSPEQRELLKRLLDTEPPTETPTAPITKIDHDASPVALPTSFAQQRLWFLDRLEPGTSAYNICDVIPFDGPLEVEALQKTINEIVRRHESLRTTFGAVDGAPVQIIAPNFETALPLIDLSPLGPVEGDAEAQRLILEECQRKFDLSRGPLFCTTLLRMNEEEHLLMLNMHHIISDAWSLDLFKRELRVIYEAFQSGASSPLPDLPLQYADFAVWQRDWMRGATLDKQLGYWKGQLTGAPTVLELPSDHPRPPVQRYQGRRQMITLRGKLVADLRALGNAERATLFMTTLAAFSVFLSRYTEQEDIVVGTPIANRNRAELEQMIGFFVNTLVLRINLSGDPTFSELLARVKEVALGAYAHQDLPFEALVSELQPERDMSRNPLFQVTFQLTNNASADAESTLEDEADDEDSSAQPESSAKVDGVAAKFDLLFNVCDNGPELNIQADYNTDLFDDASVARMLDHYRMLLKGAVENPQRRLSLMPLLSAEEKHQILRDWNATGSDYPAQACLHELVEAVVEQSPESIAVSYGDKRLSYRELNDRANGVAARLRELGVGPEVPVGLCTDRSLELVVGELAILKSGGVYVPLDSDYPSERLAFMLSDVGAQVLLTQQHLLDALPEFSGEVICLDAATPVSGQQSLNVKAKVTADNLAYVIYTSGSTGKPKGVGVTHRAVTRLVCNTNYISLSAKDRVAQASNTSFDAATFEVWGALLHGAQLIGIGREAVLSPQLLAAQIRESGISAMFLSTALFNHVAAEAPDAFSSVDTVMIGGEEANVSRVREVIVAGAPRRFLNVYGPTEGTTFTSWLEIKGLPAETDRIPIGTPLANTQMYILDRQFQPVPVGVAGELYIGGGGLARGYVGAPELTAQRFVPDGVGGSVGGRLYRTGDMARYQPSGAIEFLGRRDGQIKVRGFRVEVGEIEAALRAQADIRDAVVIARPDDAGRQTLAAYVVAANGNGDGSSVSKWREQLKSRLPDYMVPAAFVLLDELPLNANGKVDKHALPAPENVETANDSLPAPPRTPVEERLTQIFMAVLGQKSVSIHDNFFDIGGHSLLATQVVSRIRQALQVEVSLLSLFAKPTVSDLAVVVEEQLSVGNNAVLPAISRVSRAGFRATISDRGSLEIPEVLKATLGNR